MELRQLKYFLSVVRLGGVGAAAEANYVTQPAVSLQIQKLEDEVGERLFERRGRRLAPTEAGRVLAAHAESILRGVDDLDTAMAGLRGLRGGHLRMGNIDAASVYVLPAVYRTFHDRYPGVRIEILVGDTARLLDALRRGHIELATTTMPIGTAEFEQLPIYRDEMRLVAHPKHVLAGKKSVTLQDVAEAGLIAYPARSVTRRLIEKAFVDNGLRLNATMDIASPEAIKSLTRAGLGASILPSSIVSTEIRRGTLRSIPLRSVRFERTIGMVFRKEDTLSPPARKFLDMVRRRFPDIGKPEQESE